MKYIATLIATAALAACSQQSSTTTTSANTADGNTTTTTTTTTSKSGIDVPSAASLGLQPGKWETKITVSEMVVNGTKQPAPPTGQPVLSCLTPEMAAKGPGEMLKKGGADCTSTNTSYSGGKINAEMTCKLPTGTMSSVTTGTYSPTTISTDVDATVTGRMSMKQKIHTEARRVGDCG